MRLHRQDEIVDAMTARIYANIPDASALESQRAARNALDAMLEAVVELEVGSVAHRELQHDGSIETRLILKLEPKP